MRDKILITGGAGKLATELKKHLKGDYLSRKDFDFTKPITLKKKYDLIVHIGAYTNVKKAEFEEKKVNLTRFEKNLKHNINILFEDNINKLSNELFNNIINGIKLHGYLKLK